LKTRFWLRKNCGQETLSFLRGNVSQQQVSDELEQMRVALDRDFSPLYLGFKDKNREFFTNQSTSTVRELYDVNENSIVFICDG